MRRFLALAASVLLASVLASAPPASAASPRGAGDPDVVPGAYIVTLEEGASPRRVANEHAQAHGADVSHVYEHALRGYSARMSEAAAARVARDSRVRSVEADRIVRIAAKSNGKPGGGSTAPPPQERPTGVARIGITTGSKSAPGVRVAVLDTGIDLDHPDLTVSQYRKNCTTEKNTDDGNGHGTHVAGTIGAIDNEIGVIGVAQGVEVVPVKVLTRNGSGSWSSVMCGVDWVTANATVIHVANMSLGGSGGDSTVDAGCNSSDALHKAICASVKAGVTYAVAAGNSAKDAKDYVPATYDEVITVSALADFDGLSGGTGAPTCRDDEDDTFASFSNFGADIDLIAPGVCIKSTWKGGGYNTISGTSMAAPHVAGAAALYIATQTTRPAPGEVKSALQAAGSTDWNSADDRDSTKEPLLNVATF